MDKQKITGIMACDPNGVISANNSLPWHCPEDIEFYRQTIAQQNIILGYNTFIEMPSTFFENHFSIVFSKKSLPPHSNNNIVFVTSIEELKQIKLPLNKACYMIGGAALAKLFLQNNLLDDFLLTMINKEYSGDRFFPLELLSSWPKTPIKHTKDFTIYHYFNPQGNYDY